MWTKETLKAEADKQAEIDTEFVKKALTESLKEALAERRERERLVWIDLMQVFMGDAEKANAALAEYIRLWEE